MRAGDIVTIEPVELVAGGDALARVDGFPIFASNVYPGDVARVSLYEVKKGFAKADLVELLAPKWLRIGGYWYPRGGMPIDVFYQTGEPPAGVWIPDQGVPPYRGRG